MPPSAEPKGKLGLLAGGGALPLRIRDACDQSARALHVIVLEGQGDPADFKNVDHTVTRLGAAGAIIKTLKAAGCTELVFAGTVRRPSLKDLRPDWWAAKFFATSGAAALGDDGLLSALINALEREGFTVIGADTLVPECLMPRGLIGRHGADVFAGDIQAALTAAKALGARDAGQAAVVRDGAIIAEESADGTDAMLKRLADVGNQGGVLAKTLKPDQERRADLPTIGLNTLQNAHAAGLNGVVVEAGNAFLMDREDAAAKADALGLFLVGIDADGGWT
tara:strand:- start:13986 stop:14825 length:840 start_codon:yes stop_codon:yes gene_type:complete